MMIPILPISLGYDHYLLCHIPNYLIGLVHHDELECIYCITIYLFRKYKRVPQDSFAHLFI